MKNVSLSLDGLSDELKARLRAWYGRAVWPPTRPRPPRPGREAR